MSETQGESGLRYETVTSADQRLGIIDVRYRVFVEEQGVPLVLEIDARDFLDSTVHVVAVVPASDAKTAEAVGAARLLRDADSTFHVGRVALVPRWRGHGGGRALMVFLTTIARASVPSGEAVTVILDAQESAIGFYRSLGYELTARERFLDAGIWHREMALETQGTGPTIT